MMLLINTTYYFNEIHTAIHVLTALSDQSFPPHTPHSSHSLITSLATTFNIPHTHSPSQSFTTASQPRSHLPAITRPSPPRVRPAAALARHGISNAAASILHASRFGALHNATTTPVGARTQWRSSTLDLHQTTYIPADLSQSVQYTLQPAAVQTPSLGTTPPPPRAAMSCL
jgi:hypothetical protein